MLSVYPESEYTMVRGMNYRKYNQNILSFNHLPLTAFIQRMKEDYKYSRVLSEYKFNTEQR